MPWVFHKGWGRLERGRERRRKRGEEDDGVGVFFFFPLSSSVFVVAQPTSDVILMGADKENNRAPSLGFPYSTLTFVDFFLGGGT